jgi:flavin reductase (DIM6/NTAB) family NADH-FMN oxidoreductase RutF/pimeloyl-ACP methyl ester carboxylesterase
MRARKFDGADGLTLAADVGGDEADPSVLLLHGGGQTRHSWGRAARALVNAGRHVVALDFRGHGDSDWAEDHDYSLDAMIRDVRAVVAQLPSKPVIVGYMMGGLVALAAAGEGDEDIARALVLVNATLEIESERLGRVHIFMHSGQEGFASAEEAIASVTANRPYRAQMDSLATIRRSLRLRDNGRWHWHFDPAVLDGDNPKRMALPLLKERLTAAAKSLKTPLLCIYGGISDLITPKQAREISALPRGAEFVELSDDTPGQPGWSEGFESALIGFLERVARRVDERPARGGVDPLTLRQALGAFATGVTVVTTCAPDGAPIGFTANSFTSVSLDPPLILFCLDKRAGSLTTFETCDCFAINVLHIGQQDASNLFMSKTQDRWRSTAWETWDTGAPILQDAMACFECEKYAAYDGGDHRIFVGRVKRVWFDPARDPLLYFQGRYRRVHVPN